MVLFFDFLFSPRPEFLVPHALDLSVLSVSKEVFLTL